MADQPRGKAGGFALIRRSLSAADCRAHLSPERREYFGRVPLRPLYRRAGVCAVRHRAPPSNAARERFVGESYSQLFSMVNLVGFLLQMFVVSRLFTFLGVGKSLFIHPPVAFIGYL